jgi:hypothetical protein
MKVATYTRISTDEERQPISLEAQGDRLSAYTQARMGGTSSGRSPISRAAKPSTDQTSSGRLPRQGSGPTSFSSYTRWTGSRVRFAGSRRYSRIWTR